MNYDSFLFLLHEKTTTFIDFFFLYMNYFQKLSKLLCCT